MVYRSAEMESLFYLLNVQYEILSYVLEIHLLLLGTHTCIYCGECGRFVVMFFFIHILAGYSKSITLLKENIFHSYSWKNMSGRYQHIVQVTGSKSDFHKLTRKN